MDGRVDERGEGGRQKRMNELKKKNERESDAALLFSGTHSSTAHSTRVHVPGRGCEHRRRRRPRGRASPRRGGRGKSASSTLYAKVRAYVFKAEVFVTKRRTTQPSLSLTLTPSSFSVQEQVMAGCPTQLSSGEKTSPPVRCEREGRDAQLPGVAPEQRSRS